MFTFLSKNIIKPFNIEMKGQQYHRVYLLIWTILITIHHCHLSSIELISEHYDQLKNDFCFHDNKYTGECDAFKSFCSKIECEPIHCPKSSVNGEINKIESNVTAKGCCPACVTYLEYDMTCDPQSKLRKCQNGMTCDLQTRKCSLPRKPTKCQIEFYNKMQLKKPGITFDFQDDNGCHHSDIEFNIQMQLPQCNHRTGDYQWKQCRGNKCFCVRPDNGEFIWGFSQNFIDSENVTCECAYKMFNKTLNGTQQEVQEKSMVFYSEIHEHCDSRGNFEPIQCQGNLCYCVDEQTGEIYFNKSEPYENQRIVHYEALFALPCFEKYYQKYKKKFGDSKNSDNLYLKHCEKELLRSKRLTVDFWQKGIQIHGLDTTTCSFDGNYAAKQCDSAVCKCVLPDGSIGLNFQASRDSSDSVGMTCMCARQIYEKQNYNKGFDVLHCHGNGNFKRFQSEEQDTQCSCVDEHGAKISKDFLGEQLDKFIKTNKFAHAISKETFCQAMDDLIKNSIIKMKRTQSTCSLLHP